MLKGTKDLLWNACRQDKTCYHGLLGTTLQSTHSILCLGSEELYTPFHPGSFTTLDLYIDKKKLLNKHSLQFMKDYFPQTLYEKWCHTSEISWVLFLKVIYMHM